MGREFNPETQRREPFLIAATRDLDENFVYAKERRLVEEIKTSLARGRRVQIYAVYTQKRDVTRRLERILGKEGVRVAVLTTEVAPEMREAWYERQCFCSAHRPWLSKRRTPSPNSILSRVRRLPGRLKIPPPMKPLSLFRVGPVLP